jgi:hypothetical protein
MKYKIIKDVNISGSIEGDVIEREPHAVEEYIKRGELEEVKEEVKKPVKKAPAKRRVKKTA